MDALPTPSSNLTIAAASDTHFDGQESEPSGEPWLIGAIVGGIVGGLILLALIIGAIVVCRKRRDVDEDVALQQRYPVVDYLDEQVESNSTGFTRDLRPPVGASNLNYDSVAAVNPLVYDSLSLAPIDGSKPTPIIYDSLTTVNDGGESKPVVYESTMAIEKPIIYESLA